MTPDDLQHLAPVPEHVRSHDCAAQHSLPAVRLLPGQRLYVQLQPVLQLLELPLCRQEVTSQTGSDITNVKHEAGQ